VRCSCVGPRRADRRPGKPPGLDLHAGVISQGGQADGCTRFRPFNLAFSAYVCPTCRPRCQTATSSILIARARDIAGFPCCRSRMFDSEVDEVGQTYAENARLKGRNRVQPIGPARPGR